MVHEWKILCCFWWISMLKVSWFLYRLDRSLGYRQAETPRFHDCRYMKLVRLSALSTGHLYSPEISLIIIYFGGWVDPRVILRPDGLSQRNILMTPIMPITQSNK
jgi:hypothetical protein